MCAYPSFSHSGWPGGAVPRASCSPWCWKEFAAGLAVTGSPPSAVSSAGSLLPAGTLPPAGCMCLFFSKAGFSLHPVLLLAHQEALDLATATCSGFELYRWLHWLMARLEVGCPIRDSLSLLWAWMFFKLEGPEARRTPWISREVIVDLVYKNI